MDDVWKKFDAWFAEIVRQQQPHPIWDSQAAKWAAKDFCAMPSLNEDARTS